MRTQTRKRAHQPSSCPDGYVPAGYVVPLRLTLRQQSYCRRAIGVSRFVYNLCVTTHRSAASIVCPGPVGKTSTRQSTRPNTTSSLSCPKSLTV